VRKRTKVDYKAVAGLFASDAEPEGGGYFRVNGGAAPITVTLPGFMAQRVFYLGLAYGVRQFRFLRPGSKILIGSLELPEFVRDLRRIRDVVNDEVVHRYVDQLLLALEAPPGLDGKNVAVAIDEEFKGRV
jgi:hypothetical protein